MQPFPRTKVWRIFLVLSLPAVVLYHFFSKLLGCPACYLFVDIGDGEKNYFTLAWYVLHDKGWHFTGMNYPYGENIIYTDNQPILAMLLRWVHHHVIPLDRHLIGIQNMLLLLSVYLGVLITYQLLRRWQVGFGWALLSSMCIIFLSPQLLRFQGHYGLAYICFLPALFLQLDYLVRVPAKKWWWCLSICVQLILMSLTHMYFLLLGLFVLFSFLICWSWNFRNEKAQLKSTFLPLLTTIIIPAVILLWIRKSTDAITDRPMEPWGLEALILEFKTTFFSFIPPFDEAWKRIFKCGVPDLERLAYVGLIGLLTLPACVCFLLRKKTESVDRNVGVIMGVALCCWLMAAGVFYQNGFEFIWNKISVLKQFRSLGRFGIPFYYAYAFVTSFLIWKLYARMRDAGLANPGRYLLFIVFVVWGFEAWKHMEYVSAPVFRENKYLNARKDNYTPVLQQAGVKAEDFQAILQFPLVIIGNENMGVTRGFWTMREGLHAAWELGLPLIDYSMSRTSISQGMDLLALISSPYAPKQRAALFNDKPILIVSEDEFLNEVEKKLVARSQKLGTFQSISLYSISPSVFTTIQLPQIDSTHNICNGWFLDFDSTPNDTAMTGEGALRIPAAPWSIWKYTDTAHVERQWIVSFWTHIDNYRHHVAVPRMMETDPQGAITQNTGLNREHIDWSEAYGSWAEVRFPMTTKGNGFTYELFMETSGPLIDNLLIRPASDTCVYVFPEMTLYNNIPIPGKH